jgi:hypothetical protein
MHAPVDALAFFKNVSADLLKAVNANAAVVPIGLKSAVQDFRKAVRLAIADVNGRAPAKKAAKKAKAPAAVVVAAKQPSQGNGAGTVA